MVNAAKNWGYMCEGVNASLLVLPKREPRQQARAFTTEQAKAILDLD